MCIGVIGCTSGHIDAMFVHNITSPRRDGVRYKIISFARIIKNIKNRQEMRWGRVQSYASEEEALGGVGRRGWWGGGYVMIMMT